LNIIKPKQISLFYNVLFVNYKNNIKKFAYSFVSSCKIMQNQQPPPQQQQKQVVQQQPATQQKQVIQQPSVTQQQQPQVQVKKIVQQPSVTQPQQQPQQQQATQQKQVIQQPKSIIVNDDRIIITDRAILDFFNNNVIDPRKFILQSIQNFQKPNTNIKTDILKPLADEINQNFLLNKELNDYTMKIQQLITRMSFSEAHKTLSPYHHMESDNTIITCNICNVFRVSTKKGLAAHQRKCGKKQDTTTTDEDNDSSTQAATVVA